MKNVIGGLFSLLLIAAAIGLFIAAIVWAFYNVWLVLGILATILVLAIIYGMATSDNEWVSSLTNLTLTVIVGGALYAIFA
ncbi:hypothetical protein [Psychrobacter sp. K31L]|uniref:hypothetical protein n=1 Tax=Psychrobacter sp. K31L TaxID=2820758 RepID=UPI001B33DA56|nr:hypothetical protein [Psychrobacter sp. K31L]MBP3945114.1 hypothetical protein [Psychrobacter sp. K31L]